MQINIEKRYFLIILGVICLLAGGIVYAYTGPSGVGHDRGELQPPTVSTYSWSGSPSGWSDVGSVGAHDFCALGRNRAHDDDHDSRKQGCGIMKDSGVWKKYVQGDGGTTYCTAYCLDW